jgi:hypothetical protein
MALFRWVLNRHSDPGVTEKEPADIIVFVEKILNQFKQEIKNLNKTVKEMHTNFFWKWAACLRRLTFREASSIVPKTRYKSFPRKGGWTMTMKERPELRLYTRPG